MFRIIGTLGIFFLNLVASDVALAEKRVALVIGNEAYMQRIENPASDASIVAAALKKIGFELVGNKPLINLDKIKMQQAIKQFGSRANGAKFALFYYSGHGIQLNGTNNLIPVDSDRDFLINLIPVTTVLETMNRSRANLKILFLDACRTPFIKNFVHGYATMDAPEGTIIGYATQPNKPAWSGVTGTNSPYAEALAKFLPVKGLSLFAMLNSVGLYVMDKTNKNQRPSVHIPPIAGTVDTIYLNPPVRAATHSPQVDASTKPNPKPTPARSLDPKLAPAESLVPKPTPAESLSLIQSAYAQLGGGDYVGARATLTRAIEKSPVSATPYSFRGFSWFLEGNTKKPGEAFKAYERAIGDLDAAIRLDPNYAPAFRHRGNTRIAAHRARIAVGDPIHKYLDDGINDLRIAVELDPESKRNANALGKGYLLKGLYRDAIGSFNAAIRIDASYASPYAGLCEAYKMLGDWTSARKNAQRAADRDSAQRSKQCLRDPIPIPRPRAKNTRS